MYLLDVRTRELVFIHDCLSKEHPYAILSHRWEDEEVTYEDLAPRGDPTKLKGWAKIDGTCRQAERDGLKYVWIDTCCIDKRSSAELSEAINSMFMWYASSEVCYVYLHDARTSSSRLEFEGLDPETLASAAFDKIQHCQWFTRGWTLQELICPRIVQFFDADWTTIGNTEDHYFVAMISERTGIAPELLGRKHRKSLGDKIATSDELYAQDLHVTLDTYSVAERMSWAARRVTTRVEDQAYSLLGIFDVNMPLLYGEGSKAFMRLQHQIISSSSDSSILMWGLNTSTRLLSASKVDSALAPEVLLFEGSGDILKCQSFNYTQTMSLTSQGLELIAPCVLNVHRRITAVVLNCHLRYSWEGPLSMPVHQSRGRTESTQAAVLRVDHEALESSLHQPVVSAAISQMTTMKVLFPTLLPLVYRMYLTAFDQRFHLNFKPLESYGWSPCSLSVCCKRLLLTSHGRAQAFTLSVGNSKLEIAVRSMGSGCKISIPAHPMTMPAHPRMMHPVDHMEVQFSSISVRVRVSVEARMGCQVYTVQISARDMSSRKEGSEWHVAYYAMDGRLLSLTPVPYTAQNMLR